MMGTGYLANPLIFIVQTLFQLYILVVLLRFFLQLTRADFYNPLSQFIVKVTSPVLIPLRRLIPGMGGIDIASLALAWALKTLELMLVLWYPKGSFTFFLPLLLAIPELVELTINIFFWAILIQAILSWINPGTYNPASALLYSLTLPVVVLKMLILPPLRSLAMALAG